MSTEINKLTTQGNLYSSNFSLCFLRKNNSLHFVHYVSLIIFISVIFDENSQSYSMACKKKQKVRSIYSSLGHGLGGDLIGNTTSQAVRAKK